MNSQKNKDRDAAANQGSTSTLDSPFAELLEALAEEAKERIETEEDPFASYVQRVRSKMHSDSGQFRTRFTKGYQILLEQLKHEKR